MGASNLTLALPRIVYSLQTQLPGKTDILSAHGHGRSYLKWSHVGPRGLPGIRDAQIWQALVERPPAEKTTAIITDLGCDLFYGEKPGAIIESVSTCMERLHASNIDTVFVRPPLNSLSKLSATRYYLVKNLFFPGPTPSWTTMKEYIHNVDEGTVATAERLNIPMVTPREEWYGVDPIHILRKQRSAAWEEILSHWNLPHKLKVKTPTLNQSIELWKLRPAVRSSFRKEQVQSQPVRTYEDGSTLSIY